MGADLILAIAVMPESDKPEEWKAAYNDAISKLTDDQALDIYEEMHGELPEETLDDNPPRTQRWLPALVARKSYRELVDIIDEDRRDCNLYKIGNRWALISGGMSWGDDPSDSWNEVQLLSTIWYCVHGE